VDGLTKAAALFDEAGDSADASALRARAVQVWMKISPLGRAEKDGLPPHQQPADVYLGPGYEGRGGWTWYTGAAARMLWAAYGMLGIGLEKGQFGLADHAFEPRGALTLKSVTFRGRVYGADKTEADAAQ
jgi:cyclic beta-1,2-glucan synthetase